MPEKWKVEIFESLYPKDRNFMTPEFERYRSVNNKFLVEYSKGEIRMRLGGECEVLYGMTVVQLSPPMRRHDLSACFYSPEERDEAFEQVRKEKTIQYEL